MAVTRTIERTKLIVRVEAGEGAYKNMTFSSIKESAPDEALFAAGNAIGDLQKMPVESVRRSEVSVLTEKE